jgi:hypothetical protein
MSELTRPHLIDGEWVHLPLSDDERAMRELDEAAHAHLQALLEYPDLTRVQFRFMVKKLGIGTAIETAIDALPDATEQEQNAKIMAEVLYSEGQAFHRHHPLFTDLLPAIPGMTEERLNTIWKQAAAL